MIDFCCLTAKLQKLIEANADMLKKLHKYAKIWLKDQSFDEDMTIFMLNAKTAKNILTMNHEEAVDFFMKSEQYHFSFYRLFSLSLWAILYIEECSKTRVPILYIFD